MIFKELKSGKFFLLLLFTAAVSFFILSSEKCGNIFCSKNKTHHEAAYTAEKTDEHHGHENSCCCRQVNNCTKKGQPLAAVFNHQSVKQNKITAGSEKPAYGMNHGIFEAIISDVILIDRPPPQRISLTRIYLLNCSFII